MTAEHFRGSVLSARAGLGIPVLWFLDSDGAGPSAPLCCLEMAAPLEGALGRLACSAKLRAGLSSKFTNGIPDPGGWAPRAAPAAAGLLGEADGPSPSSPPAPFSPSPEAAPDWPLPAASATTQMSQPYDFTAPPRLGIILLSARARYLGRGFGRLSSRLFCHPLHRLRKVLLTIGHRGGPGR